ncbi:hypothetical protein GTP38_12625 [Duganella sp. FT94W]|uniref:DUF4019 domain-containing protein n=1 Tax=Duganella lactea TaxID=2692173 RepID=A0ABW9V8T2_9BURK|nr:hypothetical protein [Duganella lactea]MYM35175.1 hypothetical protein [Duganella lactea]
MRRQFLRLAHQLCALSFFTVSLGAHAAAEDPVRSFADAMAQQIVDARDAVVYEAISPKVRQAYTREQLIAPLKLIRETNGALQAYEYKRTSQGKRGVGEEWIRQVRFTYAVQTARYPKGRYLNVDVTQENGRYWLAGYSVEHLLGTY